MGWAVTLLSLISITGHFRASEPPPPSIPEWRMPVNGIETCWTSGMPYCRYGSDRIFIVRIDPRFWKFFAHHYTTLPGAQRLTSEAWRMQLGATLVINAGQYTEDFTHLGILLCDGKNFGTRRHRLWKGILLAEPIDPSYPLAQTIDLNEYPEFDVEGAYSQAVQTMMLVDSNHLIRVNQTDKQARRTLVAEDTSRRILLIVTEGDYTLWEIGQWILGAGLDVTRALAMDGGAQAQLALDLNSDKVTIPQKQMVLPAVVAVKPRDVQSD